MRYVVPALVDDLPTVGDTFALDCPRCGAEVAGPVVWVNPEPDLLAGGHLIAKFAFDGEHSGG